MAPVEIDWSSAEVADGELTVQLSQPPSSAWRKRFRAVQAQLERAGEPWEQVRVKKDRLVVAGVEPGAEDDVRHFVESVVLQANAAERDEHDDEDEHDPGDRRMTEAFQAFAREDAGAAQDG
ncbi:MAG TPA: hypothetical protein VFV85_07170 [Conexibacter sp.]|nr:hypothetical protein [Conexibacter sp.]